MRHSSRWLALGLTICALGLAGAAALQLHSVGFPDGYVTARQRAMKPFAHVVIWVSALASLAGVWFAWIGRSRDVSRSLAWAAAAYLALIIAVVAVALVVLPTLDDGAGG